MARKAQCEIIMELLPSKTITSSCDRKEEEDARRRWHFRAELLPTLSGDGIWGGHPLQKYCSMVPFSSWYGRACALQTHSGANLIRPASKEEPSGAAVGRRNQRPRTTFWCQLLGHLRPATVMGVGPPLDDGHVSMASPLSGTTAKIN